IHPADRENMKRLLDESIATGRSGGEWRVVWPDGSVHWIEGRWRMFNDQMGSWRLDLKTGHITGSEELDSIFGLTDSPESIAFTDLQKMVSSENWERLAQIRQSMLDTGEPTEFELSSYRPD